MHFYEGYHFGGMHFFWWVIWMVLLVWVFVTPYSIPGERKTKNSPLDILQKRFAAGDITAEDYEDRKRILKRDEVL